MSTEDVAAAAKAYRRATQQADTARETLHTAILAALAEGTPQAELARLTGYTRERLRQIARTGSPKPG